MRRGLVLACALTAALAGCSDDEDRLAGERAPLRPASEAGDVAATEIRPIPPARPAGDWTQVGGGPERSGGHLAAPSSLSLAWSVEAGAPVGERAAGGGPVVADGAVFLRDGASAVLAFDAASGRRLWRTDLTLEGEDADAGHGGGVAVADGVVAATTGFGEIAGLDPATGEVRWRRRANAPFRAAPAAGEGLAVAVTRADRALAADLATGEPRWTVESVLTRAGSLQGSAPALARGVAVVPYHSGELQLLRSGPGLTVWSQTLISSSSAEGMGAFPDVTSAPVIGRSPEGAPIIVAGNAGGALEAFEGTTGRRLWRREFGSLSPVWAAEGTLFVATTEPRLARLDLMTGRTLWATTLDAYEDPEDREGAITYAGPVLAGGRLLTASTDGRLLSHDPETGAEISVADLPGGASVGPVVAGGTVYLLTDGGRLLALR
ncbi:MAG TPA: PQQ-binding-like beta-propeller repeat protein [Paracoccaceae bacterium]|nr:PQQ-binding-like beta-propeller repeat protein [Paracoccaceae bacterium]